MANAQSSDRQLRATVVHDKRRIDAGVRPLYHAIWRTTPDGVTVDVTIRELPIIHLFVPDQGSVGHGARTLIARALGVDQESFDVAVESEPDPD